MTRETEQVLQNDPLSGSQRTSAVRFAVAPGWSVVSVALTSVTDRCDGRTLSAWRVGWTIALRGPFGRRERASGRADTRQNALEAARRAAWTLSGGVGRRPVARDDDWARGWVVRRAKERAARLATLSPGVQARDPATDRRKLHSRPDWQARQRLRSAESLGMTLEEYDALSGDQSDAPAPDAAWDDDASWGQ